jgi:nucleoside-diphosphate kinase
VKQAITDSRNPLRDESIGIIVTGSVVTVGQARAFLKRLSSD